MKKILYFIAVSMVVFTSCDSLLDIKPKDLLSPDQYYTTEKELETALSGVYSTFLKSGTYLNNLGRLGLDADEAWCYREVGSVANYAPSPNDEKIEAFWRDFYAGISRANMLLQNIDIPTDISEDRRNAIKGEALFLRSFFYFMLVSNFGDVPLVLKTIETAELDELRPKRTEAKLVYEQIIRDLEEAAELVQSIEETKSGGRVNKSAVYGLLARVNLYMAGHPINDKTRYQEVIRWTDKIITNPIHKLNPSFQNVFEKLARDEYGYEEVLFEIEFMGNGTGIFAQLGGNVGVNNGIQNSSNEAEGHAYSYLMSTYYTYHAFEEGDLRRDWAIATFSYGTDGSHEESYLRTRYFQRYIGKFRRISEILTPKHANKTPQNYPIIRLSDVLLMRAEAENEVNLGPNDMAYECINTVRRRGYGKYLNGIGQVSESLKSIVITDAGTGYTSVPTITITGGGGEAATATATVSEGKINAVTITNPGIKFSSLPTITITGGNGSGAVLTPELTALEDADLKDHSYGSFLEQIQEERTRELAFENMRKGDLVRWGIFMTKMGEMRVQSLTAPSWSALPRLQEYFSNADERHVLWPIPSDEIGVNPKLTQNPGY